MVTFQRMVRLPVEHVSPFVNELVFGLVVRQALVERDRENVPRLFDVPMFVSHLGRRQTLDFDLGTGRRGYYSLQVAPHATEVGVGARLVLAPTVELGDGVVKGR